MSKIEPSAQKVKSYFAHAKRFPQKQWDLRIISRKSRQEYSLGVVIATNGRTFLTLYSRRISCLMPQADVTCELYALASALNWLRHLVPQTNACITLSASAVAILLGEAPCPSQLINLRTRLLGQYFSLPGVTIRERRAA